MILFMITDKRFWPNPDTFDPERFTRPYKNPEVPSWNGFDPEKWSNRLYPDEVSSDFAFMPFGAGPRKCVGDEFAIMEAVVIMSMVLRRFDFEFDKEKYTNVDIYKPPQTTNHPVGIRTGATIHTKNGLNMLIKKRVH